MKCFILASFALLIGTEAKPQSLEFWAIPDTLLNLELPLDSTMTVAQIDYGDAAAGDSIAWAWKRIQWEAPAGWEANLCDVSECYTGVPLSAVQWPIGPTDPSFLKLLISSRGIPGIAMGEFWVFPEGQIENHLTLHFTFSSGLLATPEVPANSTFQVHPNPTQGRVQWTHFLPEGTAWELKGAVGEVVQMGRYPQAPDLMGLPAGHYFLVELQGRQIQHLLKLNLP